jgi:hypothetical protein
MMLLLLPYLAKPTWTLQNQKSLMFDSCGMLILTFGVENFMKMIVMNCDK